MEDLVFYRKLKYQLEASGNACTDIHIEVCNRLETLEFKNKQLREEHWDRLCNLIEITAIKFERDNKTYVDITVGIEGNSVITITNNTI